MAYHRIAKILNNAVTADTGIAFSTLSGSTIEWQVDGITVADVALEGRLQFDASWQPLDSMSEDGIKVVNQCPPEVRAVVTSYTSGGISVWFGSRD